MLAYGAGVPDLSIILIAVAVLAAVLFLRQRRTFTPPATRPVTDSTLRGFTLRPSVFVNRSELAFFHALRRAVPLSHHVLTKTRMEDVIGVRPGISGEARWKLRARVKSRHFDFLVVDGNGVPCVAVELDGKSHTNITGGPTSNADRLKDGLCDATGLPLVRVRVGEDFSRAARRIASQI